MPNLYQQDAFGDELQLIGFDGRTVKPPSAKPHQLPDPPAGMGTPKRWKCPACPAVPLVADAALHCDLAHGADIDYNGPRPRLRGKFIPGPPRT